MRNKPDPNYFFLEAVGLAIFAGAFTGAFAGAFFAIGLFTDLDVVIILLFIKHSKCNSDFDP